MTHVMRGETSGAVGRWSPGGGAGLGDSGGERRWSQGSTDKAWGLTQKTGVAEISLRKDRVAGTVSHCK